MRLLGTAALVFALAAPSSAFAQLEDDLLAPLTPSESKPKKKKTKPRETRDSKANRDSKDSGLDDLVSPLKPPTELHVTLQEQVMGARLFIDGNDMGLVSGQPVEVTPGEHRILVKRPGFDDFLSTVKIGDGEREAVPVYLIPSAGVLNVQPNVPAADVYLDGKLIGKGPIRDLVVKPGSYEVRVSKAGYSSEVSKLSMRAGKDYTLTPMLMPELMAKNDRPTKPNLEPSKTVSGGNAIAQAPESGIAAGEQPWFGRWYVWAGAAAVVAAAGGGTYVAMNQKPAGPSVGTVCGSSGCDWTWNAPSKRSGPALTPAASKRATTVFIGTPAVSF